MEKNEASKAIDFEKEADLLTGELLFANPMHRKSLLSKWARSLLARAWDEGREEGNRERDETYWIPRYSVQNPYKEPERK